MTFVHFCNERGWSSSPLTPRGRLSSSKSRHHQARASVTAVLARVTAVLARVRMGYISIFLAVRLLFSLVIAHVSPRFWIEIAI